MMESFSGFFNLLSLNRAEKDGHVLKMMEPAKCLTDEDWGRQESRLPAFGVQCLTARHSECSFPERIWRIQTSYHDEHREHASCSRVGGGFPRRDGGCGR